MAAVMIMRQKMAKFSSDGGASPQQPRSKILLAAFPVFGVQKVTPLPRLFLG